MDRTLDDPRGSAEVYHVDIADGEERTVSKIVRTVGELEGRRPEDLGPFYTCLDDLLTRLFESPPDPEAQAELTFTYEGYRITVYQGGHAVFRRLGT